jgi:hypothetical protein
MANYGAQLHFFCTFRLRRTPEGAWTTVFETVRRWVEPKIRPARIPAARFLESGEWRSPNGGRCVVVAFRSGDAPVAELPRAWAMRLTHGDADVIAREWVVDIGLFWVGGETYEVAIAVEHSARPGFSIDLPSPEISAPDVVRRLLELEGIEAVAGSQRLSAAAVPVRVGDGEFLRQALESKERAAPLIYVSRAQGDFSLPVSPEALARHLAGAAVVMFEDQRGLDEELQYLINRSYRCFGGAIRLYQPRLRLDDALDQGRHRYLRSEEIREEGGSKALEAIVHAVTRRPDPRNRPSVSTVEDVDRLIREARVEELRTKASDGHELARLYEADLTQAKAEKARLAEEFATSEGHLEKEMELHEETRRQVRRLEIELDAARGQAEHEASTRLAEFAAEFSIPTSLSGVLTLVERFYPGRLVVTERARESANKSKLRPQRMDVAWSCLRAIASVLWKLHCKEKLPLREIITRFRGETGFELSTGESEGTMADRRLAAKRRIEVAGKTFDISSHVKYGRKAPDCLRVHYAVDGENGRLVIGHCGDHLDTVSTN